MKVLSINHCNFKRALSKPRCAYFSLTLPEDVLDMIPGYSGTERLDLRSSIMESFTRNDLDNTSSGTVGVELKRA